MIHEVFKQINWLHVLVAAIGYFALGAIWYSPVLFAKRWVRYIGIDMSAHDVKKGVAGMMFKSFVLMFINCTALAILAEYMMLHDFYHGVHLGLLAGVGFAFTSIAINMLYEMKPTGLFLINGSYQILGNIIAAVIICCWR